MNTDDSTTSTSALDALDAPEQAIAADADSLAASDVATLGLVQQARLSSQNRALTAAIAVYGKESTQAAAATQAVASTQAASGRLTVLSQQVTTPQPTVPASGWALHGRVYDTGLNPQTSFTVFLVDAQKNYASEYGFSYTDDTGYFLISYPGASAGGSAQSGAAQASSRQAQASPAPQPQNAQAPAPGEAAPAADAGTSQSAAPALYLQVTDADANPVLLSEVSFSPVVGQAQYQVVTLPAGNAKLGDPPAAVRAVAMPPPAPKSASGKGKKGTASTSSGS